MPRVVLQEVGAEAEARTRGHDAVPCAADNGTDGLADDLAELKLVGCGRLSGAMAKDDVTQFVGQHARELPFRSGCLDHAAAHKYRSARQREGVEVIQVDDIEQVPERRLSQLGGNSVDETACDVLDVRVYLTIPEDRKLPANDACGVPSQSDVFLR